MNLTTTLLFYLLFGAAVAVAVHVAPASKIGDRWFRTSSALVFWPFYLPMLLQPAPRAGASTELHDPGRLAGAAIAGDNIDAAIRQVEAELDLALVSLGGWSDAALAREQHRFEELRIAWHAQADKIRDLDRILGHLIPAETASKSPETPSDAQAAPGERIASSQRARAANIARLRSLRERLHGDLMNTLAWVRELVTMIHLARYTGAPASRAEELVTQIATSIEGLSEVAAWRDADETTAAEAQEVG